MPILKASGRGGECMSIENGEKAQSMNTDTSAKRHKETYWGDEYVYYCDW